MLATNFLLPNDTPNSQFSPRREWYPWQPRPTSDAAGMVLAQTVRDSTRRHLRKSDVIRGYPRAWCGGRDGTGLLWQMSAKAMHGDIAKKKHNILEPVIELMTVKRYSPKRKVFTKTRKLRSNLDNPIRTIRIKSECLCFGMSNKYDTLLGLSGSSSYYHFWELKIGTTFSEVRPSLKSRPWHKKQNFLSLCQIAPRYSATIS